jgi:hypothetical protein
MLMNNKKNMYEALVTPIPHIVNKLATRFQTINVLALKWETQEDEVGTVTIS